MMLTGGGHAGLDDAPHGHSGGTRSRHNCIRHSAYVGMDEAVRLFNGLAELRRCGAEACRTSMRQEIRD